MINLRFEDDNERIGGQIRVYANRAPIGTLFPYDDWLRWDPDGKNIHVKYQFRHEETFFEVVNLLKEYKTQQGFKYLIVTSINGGYAAQLGEELIKSAGFVNLPNENPDIFFLE